MFPAAVPDAAGFIQGAGFSRVTLGAAEKTSLFLLDLVCFLHRCHGFLVIAKS
jgi:hypothetical protein